LEEKKRPVEDVRVVLIVGSSICVAALAPPTTQTHCHWPKELSLMFD
jgi:hypothetical protein